jgi:hypothetical protein
MPQKREWRNRSETLTLIDTGGHLTHMHRKYKNERRNAPFLFAERKFICNQIPSPTTLQLSTL